MKPNAKMISGAMAAESALAREETKELEAAIDGLPDDHPLKTEAAAQRQIMGDLAGLPPGHPLLIAMEDARLRYKAEQGIVEEGDEQEPEPAMIRKAKKLEAKTARREERRREEERDDRKRTATKRINSSMTETMDALKRLMENIEASQEDFAGDLYALKKMDRLSNLLMATLRGVSQSKLSAGRVVANG